MPTIGTQAQRPRKCWACARNRHKKCDIHLNDGAHDAEEFIDVRCDCVCEGKIGTEYDSLIEMVMAYKTMADESEQKARTQSMLAAKSAATADEAMELIRAFLGRGYDDEGNLVQDNKGKVFEQALGRLTAGLECIAAEQEAVFAQLMNGDQYSNISDIIAQVFWATSKDDETKARDEEQRKPFWQREFPAWAETDVPDSEIAVPMETPKPTQAAVETRVEHGAFFHGLVTGRQPLMTGKVDDDWATEGGDPNREDEGWPYDG